MKSLQIDQDKYDKIHVLKNKTLMDHYKSLRITPKKIKDFENAPDGS